ncbi:hypothetical protein OPKNFCMD_6384 [Methylobacterium crusticola]|uniref:Uncharacterized protein n=1 Tax=Methylobacterium crusticola TaxID=1697972 RepID=A0ABQ4R7B2_9HYPH|nr:hypothetical protein OPKNFCMD_6384 [Methylobacterium crusticola]
MTAPWVALAAMPTFAAVIWPAFVMTWAPAPDWDRMPAAPAVIVPALVMVVVPVPCWLSTWMPMPAGALTAALAATLMVTSPAGLPSVSEVGITRMAAGREPALIVVLSRTFSVKVLAGV